MFRNLRDKWNMRIKGKVVDVTKKKTYDMGGYLMYYKDYTVLLETGNTIILSDGISNSHIDSLGLRLGSNVVINGFGRLIK